MRPTFLLLLVCPLFAAAAETVPGRWEGSVAIPERELNLIVDLAQEGASWRGSAIIPGMDLKGAPLADLAVKGSDVSFSINGARGLQIVCKATLNEQGGLAGDFVVAGNTAKFTLRKTGPPQVEALPKSTALTKEMEGEWKGEYTLFGYPRHVTLKLVSHGSDAGTAEFVIVGKKTNNLPVDMITQEGDNLTIDSPTTGVSFEGRLIQKTGELKGLVLQGPLEVALTLQRAKTETK